MKKTAFLLGGLVVSAFAFANTNTTTISRLKLIDPDLGYDGGSGLLTVTRNRETKEGDNLNSRYQEFTAVANSTVSTVDHNLGVALSELTVAIYTGSGAALTRVTDPVGSGWTIAATTGFLKTKVDITTPSSGGPFTFAAVIINNPTSTSLLTGAVAIANGGTGATTKSTGFDSLSPFTTLGDILYGGASGTGTRLVGNTTTTKKFLQQVGDGTNSAAPTWNAVGLTDGVTGTLPIANGGTNATSATSGFNNLSPVTTRGDLITRDATNNVRLGVGASGTVLTSNGTDPSWNQIVNANVASAAAIAGTKVAPAFGTQDISNTGAITSTSATSTDQVLTLDTTTTGFDSYLKLKKAGTSKWSFGNDSSDSDAFVISVGGTLGTSNAIKITASGNDMSVTGSVAAASTVTATTVSGTVTGGIASIFANNGSSTAILGSAAGTGGGIAKWTLPTTAAGLLILYEASSGEICMFILGEGATATIGKVSDPDGNCSTVQGTANKTNFYHPAAGDFRVENNRTGGTRNYRFTFIKAGT